jgi:hypothetical protein
MTHRRALVAATLLVALSTGCSVGVVAPGPGSAPPTATDTTGEELPAVYSHDGVTLHLQGLAEVQAAYVDDLDASGIRVAAGVEGPVSDCFPIAVAVVREQTSAHVVIAVGRYGPAPQVPDELDCAAIGGPPYQLEVALDAPLGTRELVDEAAGPVQPYSEAQLPEPAVPDGYSGGRLQVSDGFLGRVWQGPEQQELRLDRRDARAERGHDVVVLETTVHGRPAFVSGSAGFDDSLCLVWSEAGEGFWLCSSGNPVAALDAETLIGTAESMAPIGQGRKTTDDDGVLPAVYSHDGETLHLQRLEEIQAAYVDDPGAARVRLLVGQDGRPTFGVGDCFPLPVAVVVEQTDRQVTIAVGSYGPGTAVPDDLACPAIAPPPHELDVELDAVLGDRLLVDEAASVVAVSGQTSSRE